jgi:hypothetical protein
MTRLIEKNHIKLKLKTTIRNNKILKQFKNLESCKFKRRNLFLLIDLKIVFKLNLRMLKSSILYHLKP